MMTEFFNVNLECEFEDNQQLNYTFDHDPNWTEIGNMAVQLLNAFSKIKFIEIVSNGYECGRIYPNSENPLTKS